MATRRQAPVLARLGCSACPLNHTQNLTPKMPPTLARETRVYFLAEAPGRTEDEDTGKPLTGPSGSLLRECIPKGQEPYCSFDNVVRDRPPKNRTPVWQEIEACRGYVTKSIEQAKPKLIVGLGAVPLNWALNSTDMAGMRGRLFTVKIGTHECYFLPTYHPSFILRTAYNKKKPLQSMMGFCFRSDIQRAFDLLPNLKHPHVDTEIEAKANIHCYDGTHPSHFGEVLSCLERTAKYNAVAIDLETKGLRPYSTGAAIMSCALSFGTANVAFALDHPQSGWAPEARETILRRLHYLLVSDTIKVAHNVPFELEWLIWLYGKEVVNHASWECSQMQAHFLDERRGKGGHDDHRAAYQSLDFLCKQYFGINIKKLFKLNKKDMSKSDLGETLLYNGMDAKYGLRLFKLQEAMLKEQGLHDAYLEALPRQAVVPLMQYLGVNVDQQEVKRAQSKLGKEIKVLEAQISALPVIKDYEGTTGRAFNPLSQPEAVAVFRDWLKRPEVTIKDEKSTRYSADKGILEQIDHPLAELIVKLRNRTKLKSTYVDELEQGKGNIIYPDGLIHCSFNTTFTETGRTSSDGMNMQNWPQRNDAWVRKQIVAPKGHVIVAADYGQIEACTAAMVSYDKVLVKALWEDYDIHQEWAEKATAKHPALGPADKKLRSRIKNKLTFPAIFGARNDSIAGYLDMPVNIIDDLMEEFWSTFSGLAAWQERLMKGYYERGYVEDLTGRRHRYPLRREQAINFPIQSLAGVIVADAMCRLSYDALEQGEWHLHPRLNVHDDLTAFVPDDNRLEGAIEHIYKTMLRVPYSFVNVPLSVSVSVGDNWYQMTEIGKFWSSKDL